jgi:epoxyqueuosine reductase
MSATEPLVPGAAADASIREVGGRLRRFLDAEARRLGFSAIGVADPEAIPQAAGDLAGFLAAGHHGSMEWMATTAQRRGAPKALWPEVRSVVVSAFDYGPGRDPLAGRGDPTRGEISVHALNRDYHELVKGRLKELGGRLLAEARRQGTAGDLKVFVDTAPVMEKPLAVAAGLAWQGKNTLAVSRRIGGWFFLGVIYTTLPLPPDTPATSHCGSCRRCLDVCPTGALPAPHRIDARRCLAYLTIENPGPIPEEFRVAMGDRIYGCDDCLAVCPWNRFAATTREAKLIARPELVRPSLADLAGLDDAEFRSLFAGSPVKRIGRDRFLRNVMIAIGNARSPALLAAVEPRLADASALVRGAAAWAAGRLADPERFAGLAARHAAAESDPVVLAEWRAAAPPSRGSGEAAVAGDEPGPADDQADGDHREAGGEPHPDAATGEAEREGEQDRGG